MKVKPNTINVLDENLSPRLLKSFLFSQGKTLPQGYRLKERHVFDYEFELITYSKGTMIINDTQYVINEGDIIFRKPGQFTQGIMPYSCYFVCIDMLGNTHKDPLTYDFYIDQEYQNYCINPILESLPPVLHPSRNEKYHFLFDSILKEFINPTEGSYIILKSYILNLIYQLFHDANDPLIKNSVPLSSHYNIIKRVINYIDKNIDHKISLSDISKLSDLSPNHFHRIFTQTMGLTPNVFITKMRIEKAKDLLIRTNHTISEISIMCGFENIPYFSYLFKRHIHLSPGEFRKRHSYF
ncbi:UNVERIFIED_CONTAM: AraC-like DNA-binding protein [Acetivibrio alkalicellulosi]